MDWIAGLLGSVLRQLAFDAIFFWPGWLVLNILTLGRYPRIRKRHRNVDDYPEISLISVVGMLSTLAVVASIAYFWTR